MNTKMQNNKPARRLLILLLTAVLMLMSIGCSSEKTICGIKTSYEDVIVSENSLDKKIEESFLLLPEQYQEKIKEENFKIVITGMAIDEKFEGRVSPGTIGLTDLGSRTIYVQQDELDCLLHELCHACCFNKNTQSSFYIHYEGCEEEMKESSMDNYYTDSYDEYIVQSMSLYLRDSSCLDDFPITKFTVEEMLSGTDWIYENEK